MVAYFKEEFGLKSLAVDKRYSTPLAQLNSAKTMCETPTDSRMASADSGTNLRLDRLPSLDLSAEANIITRPELIKKLNSADPIRLADQFSVGSNSESVSQFQLEPQP